MKKPKIIISIALSIGVIAIIIGIICANLGGGGSKRPYTISFMINESVESEVTIDDNTISELPEPSLKGYTFDGWYLDKEYSSELTTTTKITDDINAYAKYSVINYTISYKGVEDATNTNPTTYNIESNTIELVDAVKTGYMFDGWYNESTKVEEIAQGSTENITLTAHWKVSEYTITYKNTKEAINSNEGGFDFETPTIELKDLSDVDGYKFKCWNDENGEAVTSIPKGTDSNVSLTALWDVVEYTITYNDEFNVENKNVTTYTIETDTFKLSSLSKTGYRFDGWYNGSTKVEEIEKGSIGNVTLTASWTKNEYSISYENTKGAENTNPIKYSVDTPTIGIEDLDLGDGYIFKGFNDEKGNKVTSIPMGSTGNLSLTAEWEMVEYTITYKDEFNVENNNPTTYTIETDTVTLSSLSNPGYMFDGWYNGDTKVEEIEQGSIGNIELEAKWIKLNKILYVEAEYGMGISQEIDASFFSAKCYDLDENEVEISVEIEGDVLAGSTVSAILSTANQEIDSVTIENIKVYDTPTITAIKTKYLPLRDDISEFFIGKDSFGNELDVTCVVKKGTMTAGSEVEVEVSTIDKCGNNSSASFTYIVYMDDILLVSDGIITGLTSKGKTLDYIFIPEEIDGVKITGIGTSAFYDSGLTSITIPSTVTTIGSSAFFYSGLTSVTIPGGVTTIGICAFEYCDSLTDVTILEGVTTIGYRNFANCSSLKTVTIPSTVTTIGFSAFYNCSSLTDITIPSSVTTISTYAFQNTKIEKITIPTTVTTIDAGAFDVYKYSTIVTELTSKPFGWVSSWAGETPVYWGVTEDVLYSDGILMYVIQDGKATVSTEVVNQEEIVIPAQITVDGISYDVTSIGDYAFYESSVNKITIPTSIVNIGTYAFDYAENLAKITIPRSVITIGESAFADSNSLIIFTEHTTKPDGWNSEWVDNIPVYWEVTEESSYSDGVLLYVIQNGYATVAKQMNTDTSITIPCQINVDGTSYNVIGIGAKAFYNKTKLVSVTIPDSVTSIGAYAFYMCSSLEKINIPSVLESIGRYAFYDCSSLNDITLPSELETIGDYAFNKCSNFTKTFISTNVTFVGAYAFGSSKYLTIITAHTSKPTGWSSNWVEKVTVYWGVTEADLYTDGVLSYVIQDGNATVSTEIISQEEVEIPSQITFNGTSYDVTGIGDYAFYSYSKLTKITLPTSILSIGTYAFYDCNKLTKVTIPESVTTIGYYGFSGCDNLTIFTPLGSKPDGWDTNWVNIIPVYWNMTEDSSYTDDIFMYVIQDGNAIVSQMLKFSSSMTIPNQITVDETTYNVTGIGDYVFYHSNISSITIPSSVKRIGIYSFYWCRYLKNITLPTDLSEIGAHAFDRCYGLTKITIPSGVTIIGEEAFRLCDKLTIYCPLSGKPETWSTSWNPNSRPVVWGESEPLE